MPPMTVAADIPIFQASLWYIGFSWSRFNLPELPAQNIFCIRWRPPVEVLIQNNSILPIYSVVRLSVLSIFFVPTQQCFYWIGWKKISAKKVHWTLRDNFLWTIVKIFFRQIIDKIILKLGRRSKLLLQDLLLILEFSTYVVTSAGLVNNLTNKWLFFPSDDGLKMYWFEFGT